MSKSRKALAQLPERYTPDFVERLDTRTNIAKAILARIGAIESDLGGPDDLSYAKRALVRRAVWIEAVIEQQEQSLAGGGQLDVGAYTQAINSLIGIYRQLGLERRQRTVRTLRDVMRAGEGDGH